MTDPSGVHRHKNPAGKWVTAVDGAHTHPEIVDLADRVAELERVGLGGTDPGTPPVATPPPALKLPVPRDLALLSVPTRPAPGYLQPWIDPDLGTELVRITSIPGLTNSYARLQVENADSTLILAGEPPSSGRLIDAVTLADRGAFKPVPFATWSNVDPNKIFGGQGNALVRQDVRTDADGRSTVIRDFGFPVTLRYEQGVADDDSAIALACNGVMYLVDPRDGHTLAQAADPGGDNLQVSRRGSRVVVVGGTTRSYLPNAAKLLQVERELFPSANHGDNWIDAAGDEWFISNNAVRPGESAGHGLAARLRDGTIAELFPPRTALANGHSSGRAIEPVFSMYDPVGMAGLPGWDQVVSRTAAGAFRVWAFTRRTVAKAYAAMTPAEQGAAYPSEPQAVPGRKGDRVYFGSNWGGQTALWMARAV